MNADIAIESFRALLRGDRFPRLDAQIDLRAENKYDLASYPIEAGFDEEWNSGTDLNSFSDELLKSALAIDAFCPVPDYANDTGSKRGWKAWFFSNRPELAHETYLAITRSDLSRGLQYADKL